MAFFEANFDGLVGPTHNYAGLSLGNIASLSNQAQVSNPKAAALEGLKKAKSLADMGMVQGIFPPQERPAVMVLKQLGFQGNDIQILQQVSQHAPGLLHACSSASSMWAANIATVSPSPDTKNGKIHFTTANLINKFHRSIEPSCSQKILQQIFADDAKFQHHAPLPSHPGFGDEGAANHTRLCADYQHPGIELFVYGQSADNISQMKPQRFPSRQTLEASQAIARKHQLNLDKTVFIQQNPSIIDQGVFHNDVIAVGNKNVLFYHQDAFIDSNNKLNELQNKVDFPLHLIEVLAAQVPLEDAITSYLFNTQLINLPNGEMVIIAPTECQTTPKVAQYLENLVKAGNTPIKQVYYFDVKQSMQNGGGPACLRLRVVMSEQELNAIQANVLLDDTLYQTLVDWVERHYRDRLSLDDLADPQLLNESRFALDELTQILDLGNLYAFQQ